MNAFLRYLWLAAILCAPLSAFAQKKPKENAEILLTIRAAAVDAPSASTVNLQIREPSSYDELDQSWSGIGSGISQSGVYTVKLKPNRRYSALMYGSAGWSYGEIKISAPAGYTVYINDKPRDTYRSSDNSPFIDRIVIRPNSDSALLPAGAALPPRVSDFVWGISAGTYSNGLSAGVVELRAANLSSALLSATALYYREPDSSEIYVTRHSDGGLLELWTYQFTLYVERGVPSGGYTVRIYSPYANRTGSGDGPYTYNETPFREFAISGTGSSLTIAKTANSVTETTTITQSGQNWTVVENSALRTTTLVSTAITGGREEIAELRDGSNVLASRSKRTYLNFGWSQEELVQEIANPDAVNGAALTTSYSYGTTIGTGAYGRLTSVSNPDGSWAAFNYDDTFGGFGNLTAVMKPFQDSPSTVAGASPTAGSAITFTYAGERNIFNELLASTETKINNVTTAKQTTVYTFPGNAPNGEPLRTETVQTYTGATASLTTTTTRYNPSAASTDFLGRSYSEINPDGTKTSYLRYKGYWWNYGDLDATTLHKWPGNPGADTTWGEYLFEGFSTAVTGSVAVTNWDGQTIDTVYLVPNRSTVRLRIFDEQGRVGFFTTYVFTGAPGGTPTFEFTGYQITGYSLGIPNSKSELTGYADFLWMTSAGRLSGHSYNDGTYVEYTRDDIGRDVLARKWYMDASGSYAPQGYIATHKTFDAAGHVLSQKISSDVYPAGNPADAVTTTHTYNLAGIPLVDVAEFGAGSYQTVYSYSNGGRTVTTTFPSGATKTVDMYLDGTPKSITGTAVVNEYHTLSVGAGGTIIKADYILRSSDLSSPTAAPRWSKTETDWAGRPVSELRPSYSGGTFNKTYTYDTAGRLVKTSEPGLSDALIEYNALQQPYRSGLDVNNNHVLDISGTDRITETDQYFEKDSSGAWWAVKSELRYKTDSSPTTTPATYVKTRLNHYSDHGRLASNYIQNETMTVDIFGNQTVKKTEVQRGTNIGLVTETTHYSDSTTDEVKVTRNGLVQYTQSKQALTSWFYYDGRGRVVKQTNPRTDTTNTARVVFVAHSDRMTSTQDSAGNTTTYGYDSAGRQNTTTDPRSKTAYQSYNSRNQVARTWGDTTYPVEYTFNDYGEQAAMSTFRAGSGWTAGTWPASPGTADTTTWAYETGTGLLLSKTDATNIAVNYTYTNRGQLARRTWARGVTTDYSYSATTGEQTGINYSDSTNPISYTYNRLGQNSSVTDLTGLHILDHCVCGKLIGETFSSYFDGRKITYTLSDLSSGVGGRTSGFSLSGPSNSGSDYSVNYAYDTYGRFNRVASAVGFNYSYLTNSNLISGIVRDGNTWNVTQTYEGNRDLLASISTYQESANKATFAYRHDSLGRRTSVSETGDLFARYTGAGLVTKWTYNDRSEVTGAQSYFGQDPDLVVTPVNLRDYTYAFDNIGNRTTSTQASLATNYSANSLNQYTQRSSPAQFQITGFAPAASSVTVNGGATTRVGDFYSKTIPAASTPLWQTLSIASSLSTTPVVRYAFIAANPESYAYDLDGNLLDDGRWHYTWDAENRLNSMSPSAAAIIGVPTNAQRQTISFSYDYLGRRVRKTVANWNVTTYIATLDRKFIYDGWNLIAEYDASGSTATVVASYTWGLDLSKTLQDGGGVGGLLLINHSTGGLMLPAYNGNGDLHALTAYATGSMVAAYEYDAFGQTLRATGSFADKNPFRFSTKYTDSETGLLYYGRRYYNPSLGRWLGRDPIEEKGGLHLYGFVGNNGVNRWDVLGAFDANRSGPDDEVTRMPRQVFNTPPLTVGSLGSITGLNLRYTYLNGTAWDEIQEQLARYSDHIVEEIEKATGCGALNAAINNATKAIGGYKNEPDPNLANTYIAGEDELKRLGVTEDMFAQMKDANASVYINPDGGATIAFQGTASLGDLGIDALNALNLSTGRYNSAINFVVGFQNNVAARLTGPVNLTGHSLGGGLAGAAALRTGYHATTYNSSGIASGLGLPTSNAASLITNYYHPSDVFVTQAQKLTPAGGAVGTQVAVEGPGLQGSGHGAQGLLADLIALAKKKGCGE